MVILGIVAHQGAKLRHHVVGLVHVVRKQHDQNRLIREADAAVVHVQVVLRGQEAVLVGDVEAPLPPLEVLLRLRPLHGLDEAGEAIRVLVQQPQAGDHLPRGGVVVLQEFPFHGFRVQAAVGGESPPALLPFSVAQLPADHVAGDIVIGVDDGLLQGDLIGIAGDIGVPIHLPFAQAIEKHHVQRHLVHAGRDPVLVRVYIVLLTGNGVVVADPHVLGVGSPALQELLNYLVPALAGKALVVQDVLLRLLRLHRLLRQSGRQSRHQHTQRQNET